MEGFYIPEILIATLLVQKCRGLCIIRKKCKVCSEWDDSQWQIIELTEKKQVRERIRKWEQRKKRKSACSSEGFRDISNTVFR